MEFVKGIQCKPQPKHILSMRKKIDCTTAYYKIRPWAQRSENTVLLKTTEMEEIGSAGSCAIFCVVYHAILLSKRKRGGYQEYAKKTGLFGI